MDDAYEVLGVSPTATQSEIAQAYRRQLRSHHPDVAPGDANPDAEERLRAIVAAYAVLRDPVRRGGYDRDRARRPTTQSPRRIAVTHKGVDDDRPSLWAGPVRWRH